MSSRWRNLLFSKHPLASVPLHGRNKCPRSTDDGPGHVTSSDQWNVSRGFNSKGLAWFVILQFFPLSGERRACSCLFLYPESQNEKLHGIVTDKIHNVARIRCNQSTNI